MNRLVSEATMRARWLTLGGVPAAIFLLFIGLPFIALLVETAQLGRFWPSVRSSVFLDAVRISLVTSSVTVVIAAVVGTPLAYVLARKRFWGREIIDACIEFPILLPPVVAGLGMLMVFGRAGLLGDTLDAFGVSIPFTTTAIVMAQLFAGAPFYLRAAKLGFEAVSPALEETAQTLGVSPFRAFFAVTIPLASRALVSGLVLCWAKAVAEFGGTLLFAGNLPGKTQTMPLAVMSSLESADLGTALALAVVLAGAAILMLAAVRLWLHYRWRDRP